MNLKALFDALYNRAVPHADGTIVIRLWDVEPGSKPIDRERFMRVLVALCEEAE